MAKHIKIKGELLPEHNFELCKVTILEQTHAYVDFGDKSRRFISTTKFRLASSSFGRPGPTTGAEFRVLSRDLLNAPVGHPSRSCVINADGWKKIKIAVKKYNAYFTDEAIAAREVEEAKLVIEAKEQAARFRRLLEERGWK